MNATRLYNAGVRRSIAAAGAALCCLGAFGAEAPASASASTPAPASAVIADAQAAYMRERALCLSGRSPQGEATCLKEAGAELEMVRHAGGKLPDESPQALAANAVRRCNVVAAADRFACEQMAEGHGIVSGSVAGGGILTEYVTIVPR